MIAPDFSGYISKPGPEIPKGAYFQMDEAEYHKYPAVSAGVLKEPTCAHMLYNRTNNQEDLEPVDDDDDDDDSGNQKAKESLVLGALVHAACLEFWKFGNDEWKKHFVMSPTKGINSKGAMKARRENPGKLLITEKLLTTAFRIRREGIESNPDALACLNSPNGMKEATGIVWDPVNSCRRKWRIDYLPMSGRSFADSVTDIKTTRKHVSDFEYEAGKLGYFLQAAWYMDSHELLTGHRLAYWRWLVVSNVEPFMSKVYFMRNLKPTDPLYAKSKLQQARERLGLDPSAKLGRLTQFLNSVREHEVARAEGQDLNFRALRNVWPAYEQTEPVEIY